MWGGGRGKKRSRAPPAPSLPSLPLFSSFSLPHPPAHYPRRRRRRSGVGGTGDYLLSRRRRALPRKPQAGGRPFFLSLALPVFLSPSLAAAPPGGLGLPRASGPPARPRSVSVCLHGPFSGLGGSLAPSALTVSPSPRPLSFLPLSPPPSARELAVRVRVCVPPPTPPPQPGK